MLKCIIFDLDNTLYREADYLFCLANFMRRKFKGCPYKEVSSEIIENNLDRRQGDIIFSLFYFLFERYPSKKEHNLIFGAYKKLKCPIKLFPDFYNVIEIIKEKRIRTAILTNGIFEVQLNKMSLLSLDKYIDHIFVNPNGYSKPNKEAFVSVADFFLCEANSVLMVGDDPVNDIEGARNAGMLTYRIKKGFFKNEPSKANYESEHLIDILNLIK